MDDWSWETVPNKLLNFVKENEKNILENKKLKLEVINYLTEYKQ